MNYPRMIDITITALSLMVAFVIYNHVLINADVAWHIEGARRILAGGDYLTNLLDNNSPFVFGFYIPVIWLLKTHLFKPIPIIITYLLLWGIISLTLCYLVINRIKAYTDFTKRTVYYSLVFIVCFLPQASFGQREIILITLFLPYFFLKLHSLLNANTTSLPSMIVALSILMAVVAIAQNPLYLALPIFIDLFVYVNGNRLRLYSVFFYLGFLLCAILTPIYYPNYIKSIIPMTFCYEPGFNFPIIVLFLEILAVISLMTILLITVHYKKLEEKKDIALLTGLMILAFLIYFLEQKLWYYHFYPVLTFTVLVLAIIAAKSWQRLLFHHEHPQNEITFYISAAMLMMITITIGMYLKNQIVIFQDPRSSYKRWIHYAQQHFANKKLFFFEILLQPSYTLPLYTNSIIVSPWSNPWFLPAMIKNKNTGAFCNPQQDLKTFFAITAKSLQEQQPDFIIVEDLYNKIKYLGGSFSYIDFFSADASIKNQLNDFYLYDNYLGLIIYKRKSVDN